MKKEALSILLSHINPLTTVKEFADSIDWIRTVLIIVYRTVFLPREYLMFFPMCAACSCAAKIMSVVVAEDLTSIADTCLANSLADWVGAGIVQKSLQKRTYKRTTATPSLDD